MNKNVILWKLPLWFGESGQTTFSNRCDFFLLTGPHSRKEKSEVPAHLSHCSHSILYYPTSPVSSALSTICPFILGKASPCVFMNKLLFGPNNTAAQQQDGEKKMLRDRGLKGEDERITSSLGVEVGEGEGGKVG